MSELSKETPLHYYSLGRELLETLADVEDEVVHNYQYGTIQQKALATVSLLQFDLFSSFLLLLQPEQKGPIVGRAVILRTIMENYGTALHIKSNEKRSKAYLLHANNIRKQIKIQLEGAIMPESEKAWSTSTITHRISLIDEKGAVRMYDSLSNFTHGNNMLYLLDNKEVTEAYIKGVNSYYIGMFIGFLSEMAIGLDLKLEKRKKIFAAIKSVGEQGKKK